MVDFKNVTFTYASSQKPSIKNINLHIKKGELLVVSGKSGCGKTTLIRLISGLAPDFFEGNIEGDVIVNSKNTKDYSIQELSKDIGMVYQDPRSQFIAMDTTSEIAFSCENQGLNQNEILRRIDKTYEELDIEYLRDKNILNLSSGEKQIIAIASVFALEPKIIIMDEPSANLDMESVEKLRKILIKLKNKGFTIIISEHRLSFVLDIADRALIIKDGEIAEELTKDKLLYLNNDELYERGLRCADLLKLQTKGDRSSVTNQEILRFDKIDFSYKNSKTIFKDCSFKAYRGQIIGLVGHNGVGKTTTLDLICGLKKSNKGKIYIDNIVSKEKQRMQKTYLVMQDSDCQLFSDSVTNELFVGLTDNEETIEKGKKVFQMLELSDYADSHPSTLSGGQKQRLCIAVSYMEGKPIVCLDEPTSGLDYSNMKKVALLLKQLAQKGCCIILSTHDYEFLLTVCTDIIHIDNHKVKEQYELNNDTKSKLYDLFRINQF